MPKRPKPKKKSPLTVSPAEARAREEIAALTRATRAQHRAKGLARSLAKAIQSADAACLTAASMIAARHGRTLVEQSESV